MKNIILGICQNYCFEFDAIYNDGDHIHLFVGAEPKYSPSKIMQKIKNIGILDYVTTSDVIKIYVENKGSKNKNAYNQIKRLDFE